MLPGAETRADALEGCGIKKEEHHQWQLISQNLKSPPGNAL